MLLFNTYSNIFQVEIYIKVKRFTGKTSRYVKKMKWSLNFLRERYNGWERNWREKKRILHRILAIHDGDVKKTRGTRYGDLNTRYLEWKRDNWTYKYGKFLMYFM